MIRGLSHITLVCRDLDRAEAILTGVLGARRVYDSGPHPHSLSPERFFLAGGLWIAVMAGAGPATRGYDHIAFAVDDAALEAAAERIAALGLEVRPARPRIAGEGRSIYFHDDDNHLFELHSGTLDDRLRAYGAAAEGRA